MGAGGSVDEATEAVEKASPEEIAASLKECRPEDITRIRAAMDACKKNKDSDSKSVPEDVVKKGMSAFEEKYNAEHFDFCGSCYTDDCHVTVNGGKDAGGFGPFTTPAEVAGFLKSLRNDMGAKDMKFTVTEVAACNHKDVWTSEIFTGACDADWVPVEGALLGWKIKRDAISATPKASMSTSEKATFELQRLSGKIYTWAVSDTRLAGEAEVKFSCDGTNTKASVFCKRSELNSGQWYDFNFECDCDVQLKSLGDGDAATLSLAGPSVSFTMELQGESLIFFEPPELETPRGPMAQCKLTLRR